MYMLYNDIPMLQDFWFASADKRIYLHIVMFGAAKPILSYIYLFLICCHFRNIL